MMKLNNLEHMIEVMIEQFGNVPTLYILHILQHLNLEGFTEENQKLIVETIKELSK